MELFIHVRSWTRRMEWGHLAEHSQEWFIKSTTLPDGRFPALPQWASPFNMRQNHLEGLLDLGRPGSPGFSKSGTGSENLHFLQVPSWGRAAGQDQPLRTALDRSVWLLGLSLLFPSNLLSTYFYFFLYLQQFKNYHQKMVTSHQKE